MALPPSAEVQQNDKPVRWPSFLLLWEIPAFVHFALEAWILQASSQPSSNTSESLKCSVRFPLCLSKGKSRPLRTLWGGNHPFPTVAWEEASVPRSTPRARALSRMSLTAHHTLLDFERHMDSETPGENLASWFPALSQEEGTHFLLLPTRPAPPLGDK